MLKFALSYYVMIAGAFCGLLQVVAAHSGIRGLAFLDRKFGYVFGSAVAVASFIWFFASGNRNIEGHITRVQGAEQFLLFMAGAGTSFVVTAVIASIVHRKARQAASGPRWGLDVIRETSYFQAFKRYFRK
jgi:hypothetical protein